MNLARSVSRNSPNTSQARPTEMPPRRQLAICCGKSVPNSATNGIRITAGMGG